LYLTVGSIVRSETMIYKACRVLLYTSKPLIIIAKKYSSSKFKYIIVIHLIHYMYYIYLLKEERYKIEENI
jgi:hypothetical protein